MDTECEVSTSRLERSGFTRVTRMQRDSSGFEHERVGYTKMVKGGSPHYYSYMPEVGCLKLETSLPKALYGENVSMLAPGDEKECLDVVSNRVSDLCGDVGDCGDWNVRGRLDSVFSWDVGDRVQDYLSAFERVNLPFHKLQSVDKESTLYWFNAVRRLRLYDKERESQDLAAKGQLRFEVQMNHAKADLLKLGIGSMRVGDVVNWETSRKVLSDYLSRLGGDLVVADDVRLVKLLVRKLGPARARRLFGAVKLYQALSGDDLRSLGFNRGMVWRDRRQVRDAGVSVGYVESGVLPGLVLPEVYTGKPGVLGG